MLGRILSGVVGVIMGFILITPFWESAITFIPYENVVIEDVIVVDDGVVVNATFEKTACVYKNMSVVQTFGNSEPRERHWDPWGEPNAGNRPTGLHNFSILVKTEEKEAGSIILVTTHLCGDREKSGLLTASRDQAGSFRVEEVVKVFAVINLED